MGLRRETLVVRFEPEVRKDEKAKTDVDGFDPFGSFVNRKRSPLPAYARVLTKSCTDRCHSHANKQDKTSDVGDRWSHVGQACVGSLWGGGDAEGEGCSALFIRILRG